jgi:hypothetical protein
VVVVCSPGQQCPTGARLAKAVNTTDGHGAADRVLGELEDLIRRINRTNAATMLDERMTVTDAIARRDALRWRHALYSSVADAASGGSGPAMIRQIRSELRYVSAVTVSELRAAAGEAAKQHRELDVRIQQANWATDLLD